MTTSGHRAHKMMYSQLYTTKRNQHNSMLLITLTVQSAKMVKSTYMSCSCTLPLFQVNYYNTGVEQNCPFLYKCGTLVKGCQNMHNWIDRRRRKRRPSLIATVTAAQVHSEKPLRKYVRSDTGVKEQHALSHGLHWDIGNWDPVINKGNNEKLLRVTNL